MSLEDLNHAKLLICNTHNANVAFWWQDGFDSFSVHLCVFAAAAMPEVHAELKHLEAIRQHALSKAYVVLPVGFGFRWQVEHNEYPHSSIGV